MGNCTFCGAPSGFLRKNHPACRESNHQSVQNILDLIKSGIYTDLPMKELALQVRHAADQGWVSEKQKYRILISGYETMVEQAFSDGVLTSEEQSRLESFSSFFGLDRIMLNRNGAVDRLHKGAVIREVLEGKIPPQPETSSPLPFNFHKSEQLIWMFRHTEYFEDRAQREFVGSSSGFSIRLAKGIYYRIGGFKGRRVDKTVTRKVDAGLLAITTKHIYFNGPATSFRIPFDKIVSFNSLENGVEIMRDGASAKPQTFITGDGWFTYNLLMNASRL